MSHLRDIQKLRQSRNPPPYFAATQRFSFPGQPEAYMSTLERLGEPLKPYGATYSDQFNNQQAPSDKIAQKREYSGASSMADRREIDPVSSSLSIYNFSLKSMQRVPNPLTSRKEKPSEINDFEIMPENEHRHVRKPKEAPNANKNLIQKHLHKGYFNIVYPIGKGGFGKVWKVEYKKTHEVLAMKEMHKAKVIQKKSIQSVMNERTLLAKLKHPFIINMIAAFQDRENLYLLMEYIDGGDLRYHIGQRRRFTEQETKFFLANMVIGLEYLHRNKIIHRDMKPENLVFDSDGYLRITDLGISREIKEDNYSETSGTPGYMSPQVICRKNHSFTADYFALGVMGYEFMMGRRPYVGNSRKQIRDQILAKQAMIKPEQLPPRWTPEASDFINKLLLRNQNVRLGCNGIEELKNHPWMASVDWKKMARKEIPAPYVPLSIQDNYEDYKGQISQDSVDENMEENLLMLRDKKVQELFQDYYFDRLDVDCKKSAYTTTAYSTPTHTNSTLG